MGLRESFNVFSKLCRFSPLLVFFWKFHDWLMHCTARFKEKLWAITTRFQVLCWRFGTSGDGTSRLTSLFQSSGIVISHNIKLSILCWQTWFGIQEIPPANGHIELQHASRLSSSQSQLHLRMALSYVSTSMFQRKQWGTFVDVTGVTLLPESNSTSLSLLAYFPSEQYLIVLWPLIGAWDDACALRTFAVHHIVVLSMSQHTLIFSKMHESKLGLKTIYISGHDVSCIRSMVAVALSKLKFEPKSVFALYRNE